MECGVYDRLYVDILYRVYHAYATYIYILMGYVVIYDIYIYNDIYIYISQHVMCDIWYNYDMWHLINDIWHVFHIWYMICESYYHIIYDRIFNIAILMYIYIHVYFILYIYILCTIDYILYTWYCRLHIQCTYIYIYTYIYRAKAGGSPEANCVLFVWIWKMSILHCVLQCFMLFSESVRSAKVSMSARINLTFVRAEKW